MEPNDTILSAELIDLDSSSPVVLSKEIGDNLDLEANNDVDFFEVNLKAGDTLSLDIDAQVIDSNLNSVLSIFDANGDLLFRNNNIRVDDVVDFDSFLEFTTLEDNSFYIGVSSARNFDYDPNIAGSGVGNSSGVYNLILSLEREIVEEEVYRETNDTILSANVIELDSSSPVEIAGEIGDNPDITLANNDVDLFEVTLNAGDTLFADINAAVNGSELDSVVTIFDSNGNLLVQNDDNSFDNVTEPDAFQQFTAVINGTYYVGVSSSANLGYDPNLAESGIGDSSGVYDLILSLEEADSGEQVYREANDTILLANSVELDSSAPVEIAGEIGDNSDIAANNDVDLFEVSLNAGDTLLADINAQLIGSGLNSVLTIFDANGNLLVQNDDNSFDNVTEPDPFLEFTALQNGTYYVGVSSSANLDYNPNVADSGVGDSSGSYLLDLTLEENPLTTPITRFQNEARPGTYLFAGPGESQAIRANFPNFTEEGQAFKVSVEPEDDLIRLNRFQNSDVPGTYLYAGEGESQAIRANFPNFIEEGIAFYVYGSSANLGVDFYRFQNSNVPGTYIFVGEGERQTILANFPNFVEEGVAFKVDL